MYIDKTSALRIERAEALMMRDMVKELAGTSRAPSAFVRGLDTGTVSYVRPGSPLNKVIGAGIDAPIDTALLDEIEQELHRRGEQVRAEMCTLADPRTYAQLGARGYCLLGFENVLARSLADTMLAPATTIQIERATQTTLSDFRDTMIEAAACPDDTGVVVDSFTRDVISTAVDDSLCASTFQRYIAYRDGALAGAASMNVQDGIAVLTGSATLATHRRRGVQSALLAMRLGDARAAGATLAIITTAPGTQSQANVMRLGFSLVYSRAVLVLAS